MIALSEGRAGEGKAALVHFGKAFFKQGLGGGGVLSETMRRAK
jgi:hypothetical protein